MMKKPLMILVLGAGLLFTSFYYNMKPLDNKPDVELENTETEKKMKIEIWSDIVCPWCYIGKRKFEAALAKFEDAKYIDVEYKSYQLNPGMETDTTLSVVDYLSKYKGIARKDAIQMKDQVTAIAAGIGLEYHLEKAVAINTLQAHALLHFAKTKGKQLEMKERLMKAYFTEALNLDDRKLLAKLAAEIGLDAEAVEKALESGEYAAAVQADIQQAVGFGVRGVPFFVFNRTYAISGAEEVDVFFNTLVKAYGEWRKANPIQAFETIEGKVCEPNGKCD